MKPRKRPLQTRLYFLHVWGDVEPRLYGPFGSEITRNAKIRKMEHSHGDQRDGIYKIALRSLPASPAELTVEAFTGAEMEEILKGAK